MSLSPGIGVFNTTEVGTTGTPGTTRTGLTAGARSATAATLALFLLIGMAAAQSSQTPQQTPTPPGPPPIGAITGVVTDGASGSPMSDVIVQISGGPLPPDYRTRQISDSRGRFAFVNLPDAENYRIATSRFGYFDGGYGRDTGPQDALRPLVVRNGGWVGNLKLPIWRPSTISGSVRDENGDPVVGVYVRALMKVRLAGREDFVVGPLTVTDDRGQYRLGRVLPGRYVIQVPSVQMTVPEGTRVNEPGGNDAYGAVDAGDEVRLVIGRYPLPPPRRDGRAMVYPAAFHPAGSAVAEATSVEVKYSEDRPGIDVTLTPVPAVRLSGVVDGPAEALNGLTLRLLPAGLENLGLGAEAATALVGGNGTFTFVNVPAGTYTLEAPLLFNEFTLSGGTSFSASVGFGPTRSLPNPPPSGSWSRTSSTVDLSPDISLTASDFRNGEAKNYSGRTGITVGTSNVTGVRLKLYPLGVVRGRFMLEADPSKPAAKPPATLVPTLDPARGEPRLGVPRGRAVPGTTTHEFEVSAVHPAEYWVRSSTGEWIVKSVMWQGRDYTFIPINTASADDLSGLVITLTNATPTLTGTVRLPDGATPDAPLVVVFPAQAALRTNTGLTPTRIRSVQTLANGSFTFTTLPAGDYFVAAIDPSHLRTWRDPEFLAKLERQASRVTLTWGQPSSHNLTMVGR